MQPHQPRSRAAARAAARTLFKDSLAWLRGYPLGPPDAGAIRWTIAGELGRRVEPATISLTPEHLRRAAHAVRRLPAEFPRAVQSVLEDPAGWCALASRRIDSLSMVLQGKRALPDLAALLEAPGMPRIEGAAVHRCVQERPLLVPLAAATAWVQGLAPGRLRKALSLITDRAGGFETILVEGEDVLEPTLRIIDLVVEDGVPRTAALLDSLMDSRWYRMPLEPGKEGLRALASAVENALRERLSWLASGQWAGHEPPRAPPLEMAAEPEEGPQRRWLIAFAVSLAREDAAFRRRALRLFGCLRPRALLDHWERWSVARLRLRAEARRLLESPPGHASNRALARLLARLGRLQCREPPVFRGAPVAAAVLRWSDGDLSRLHAAVVRALERIPALFGSFPLRQDLFLHLDATLREHPGSASIFACFQRALTAHLQRAGSRPHQALAPWIAFLERRWLWKDLADGTDACILRGEMPADLLGPLFSFYEALGRRAEGARLHEVIRAFAESSRFAAAVLRGARDGARAAELVLSLAGRIGVGESAEGGAGMESFVASFGSPFWEWMVEVSSGDAERFAGLAAALHEADWFPSKCEQESFLALARSWDDPESFTRLILDGETCRLIGLSEKLVGLRSLGRGSERLELRDARLPEAAPPGNADHRRAPKARAWLSKLPAPLRGPAKELVRLDGSRRVREIFAEALPGCSRMEREIEAIGRRIPDAEPRRAEFLRRRLTNLEARLAATLAGQSAGLSPARILHLREKIERRVRRAGLEAREEALEEALHDALSRRLPAVPDGWTRDAAIFNRIRHALALRQPGLQSLVLQLLSARAGPPPWDLRDAPENQAFLRRMQRLGIQLQSWVDGNDVLEEVAPTGETLRAALERDPLEVLGMGEPFSTCLSPGDTNYYSAVANAVDINKKVVYVRGRHGRVLGRCLLAMTREGSMLAFRAYAVDTKLGLAGMLARFAAGLAGEMGTHLTSHGKVEKLVAPDWYDDGPVDIAGRFEFLEDGSDFRKRLRQAAPAEVIALCRKATAPLDLDPVLLLRILKLWEFDARPGRVLPLLPAVRSLANRDLEVIERASDLSLKAGATEEARGLVMGLAASRRWSGNDPWETAPFLLRLGEHSAALRVLRTTRPPAVRRWDDEGSERLGLAAEAHEGLSRLRVSLRLYRQVAALEPACAEYREKVALLETLLG